MEKKEKMINEAVSRMKSLGLYSQIITEFQDKQKLEYSEHTPLGGILYWVSNKPEWEKIIENFETEYNSLVYHAIHSHTEFGELLSLLYVSPYEDEWEYDREDIRNRQPLSYVINLDIPEYSEFGSIGVREAAGGLIRTA